MVKITLFKDIPFNNGCVMSNFLSFQDQKNFFNNYPSNKKLVLNDVKISKLDAPILITLNISQLFNFTYGAIDFNNQRVIYFSVNRFEIETLNKTWLYFNIDYWETYRYPINNENGLKLGRGRISRCSLDIGDKIIRPFTPNSFKYTRNGMMQKSHTIIFTYHNNTNNINSIMALLPRSGKLEEILGFDVNGLNDGYGGHINSDNIFGMWVSPFDFTSTELSTIFSKYEDDPDSTDLRRRKIILYGCPLDEFDDRYRRVLPNPFDFFIVTGFGQQATGNNLYDYDPNKKQLGITDMFGNIIWESKNNKFSNSFGRRLNVSMSSCVWSCFLRTIADTFGSDMNGFFTIPCEPIDLFSDAFRNYYTQERPFLAELRARQNEKQVIDSVCGMGTSAIGGAVAGSMVAPGLGTIAGAVGGLTASGVGAIANYYTNQEFNKQIQKIEDAKALIQTDQLKLYGKSFLDFCCGTVGVSLVSIAVDDESYNAYLEDVNAFGYYYNREYNDLDNLLTGNSTFKITCNCEVENVPAIAEQSVKSRLSAGVKFIRPT